MKINIKFVSLLLICISIANLKSQELAVKNVAFTDQGDSVLVTYDLEGKSKRNYDISLSLSSNFGSSFKILPKELTGDVGKKIKPGAGKKIVWHVKKDFPWGLIGDGFVFAVGAEYQKKGRYIPYYVVGAGAVGGIIYLINSLKQEPETGKLVIEIPAEY